MDSFVCGVETSPTATEIISVAVGYYSEEWIRF